MRPLIPFTALLWLQGLLAEVRWALVEWGGWACSLGACLGFPALCGAPQLVCIMDDGSCLLSAQARVEARRTDCSSLLGCWLPSAGCTVACFQECLSSRVWQGWGCGSQAQGDSSLWSGSSLYGLSRRSGLQRPLHICFPNPLSSYRKMHAHPWKGAQTGRVKVGVFTERERCSSGQWVGHRDNFSVRLCLSLVPGLAFLFQGRRGAR